MKTLLASFLFLLATLVVAAGEPPANQAWISGPSRASITLLSTPQLKPYIPIELNGHSLFFMVDTGGMTLLDLQVAKALGITTTDAGDTATTLVGSGGARQLANVDLQLGKLKVTHYQVSCIDLSYFKALEKPELSGIIGSDLLKLLRARLDYGDNTLVLLRPKS